MQNTFPILRWQKLELYSGNRRNGCESSRRITKCSYVYFIRKKDGYASRRGYRITCMMKLERFIIGYFLGEISFCYQLTLKYFLFDIIVFIYGKAYKSCKDFNEAGLHTINSMMFKCFR